MSEARTPATVAALREVLAGAFCERRARPCLMRMRKARLLPIGGAGRAEIKARGGRARPKPISRHARL